MTKSKNKRAKSKNKGAAFYKRIPCPEVGPGWTRVFKVKSDGTRYCDEFYSPQNVRCFQLRHTKAREKASKYKGEWLSTRR